MTKLIGYARVSTRDQTSQRQLDDIVAAGVRNDDLYTDAGVSGSRADRPALNQALGALQSGDTLVVTTLDRLGRSTLNMLSLAAELDARQVGLRVLNLGGVNVDTSTPMGAMLFTVTTALAQMELEIKRERIRDSVAKRRSAGKDLGGRRMQFTTVRWSRRERFSREEFPRPRSHVILECHARLSTVDSRRVLSRFSVRGL